MTDSIQKALVEIATPSSKVDDRRYTTIARLLSLYCWLALSTADVIDRPEFKTADHVAGYREFYRVPTGFSIASVRVFHGEHGNRIRATAHSNLFRIHLL